MPFGWRRRLPRVRRSRSHSQLWRRPTSSHVGRELSARAWKYVCPQARRDEVPMSVAKPELLTTEQLLALPENGKERWLIRGELREKPWLFRTQGHARGAANLVAMLANWNDHQPGSRGEV